MFIVGLASAILGGLVISGLLSGLVFFTLDYMRPDEDPNPRGRRVRSLPEL